MIKEAFNNHVDKKRGEGVHQMSTIVHVREGGGHCSVHVDKILKKKLATKVNIYLMNYKCKNLFPYWVFYSKIETFLRPIKSFKVLKTYALGF